MYRNYFGGLAFAEIGDKITFCVFIGSRAAKFLEREARVLDAPECEQIFYYND